MNFRSFPLKFFSLFLLSAFAVSLGAKVGALGKVIPKGDLLYLPANGAAVAKIHVQEGDHVESNAPLITFSNHHAATKDVAIAQLNLREVEEVGALNIEAMEMNVAIAQHTYDFSLERYERFKEIGGAEISVQQMELRTYERRNTELLLQAARQDLARGEADHAITIEQAKAQLEIAEGMLAATTLRAPAALTVVKLLAQVGTVPGGPAIILGDLSEMQVLTEVFAGDLAVLKIGQAASITSNALPHEVRGELISISRLVIGQSKVVEVLVRVNDPAEVHDLIHLEVNVSIED